MSDLFKKILGKKASGKEPAPQPNRSTAAPLKAPRRVVSPLESALGKSFVGPGQWLATLGVDVGVAYEPAVSDIKKFISSPCPIYPHKKIGETHLLCLIPEKIGKEACSLRALDTLCAGKKIASAFDIQIPEWRKKKLDWIDAQPVKSEWIWVVRGLQERGLDEYSFFRKTIQEQESLLGSRYPEYRQGSVLEGITAAVLAEVAHDQQFFSSDYYRCSESSSVGGRLMIKGGKCRVFDTDQPQHKASGVGLLLVRPAEV